MIAVAEAENTLFGARLFFIAARTTEHGVELMLVQGLSQRLGFHHVGVNVAAVAKRSDVLFDAFGVGVGDQLELMLCGHFVAKRDHFFELPGGVDVHQREGQRVRRKGFARQMQQHGAVFADGVQQHRLIKLRHYFSHYMDSFGFK